MNEKKAPPNMEQLQKEQSTIILQNVTRGFKMEQKSFLVAFAKRTVVLSDNKLTQNKKKLKRKRRSSSSCSKKRNQKKPCYMRLWPLLPFDETRREETSINSFAHNNHHSSAWYRDTSIIVWQKYWILLCQNYFCTSKVKRQISGEFDTCKV